MSATRLAQLKEEEAELTELLSHYANAYEEYSEPGHRVRRIDYLALREKRDRLRSQIAMLERPGGAVIKIVKGVV